MFRIKNQRNYTEATYYNLFSLTCLYKYSDHQKQPPGGVPQKGVLGNLAKFKEKRLCQSPSFNKVAGLRPATLLKKRLWHKCFPVNFAKFLRTSFLTKHLRWLLLDNFNQFI